MLGYQNFVPDASGTQNSFNFSKILSALVPGIKNDYSLMGKMLREGDIIQGQYITCLRGAQAF